MFQGVIRWLVLEQASPVVVRGWSGNKHNRLAAHNPVGVAGSPDLFLSGS